MAFQPFGYKFELLSPSTPCDVKAAIRSRKKGWLEQKNGARGWIIGPVLCLWFSAFDRYGPMLFGLITQGYDGTRVHGRAGSDLNGVMMFSLLLPLMAWIVFTMIADGSVSARELVVFALVFLIGGPLMYWSAHKDRRDAEPLVRFLRDAITAGGQALRAKSATVDISPALSLDIAGETCEQPLTPAMIHDALLNAGARTSVILASGPESYIQTVFRDGSYIVEMRKGGSHYHFKAVRRPTAMSLSENDSVMHFNFEEVCEAFMAYATGSPTPHFLKWEPMRLADL
jgi:hypothetical protein